MSQRVDPLADAGEARTDKCAHALAVKAVTLVTDRGGNHASA